MLVSVPRLIAPRPPSGCPRTRHGRAGTLSGFEHRIGHCAPLRSRLFM